MMPARLVATVLLLTLPSTRASCTDFGVRRIGWTNEPGAVPISHTTAVAGTPDIRAASTLGAHYGRITSILRSPTHNRAVGGVINSYHLRGRAIDIARRPGVTHGQVQAALRRAGYQLLESIDEGDHSHFAFGGFGSRAPALSPTVLQIRELTNWGLVFAPGIRGTRHEIR